MYSSTIIVILLRNTRHYAVCDKLRQEDWSVAILFTCAKIFDVFARTIAIANLLGRILLPIYILDASVKTKVKGYCPNGKHLITKKHIKFKPYKPWAVL